MGFSLKSPLAAVGAIVNPTAMLGMGLNYGADLYSAHEQSKAAERANRTNIDLTHEQMDFQRSENQKAMDFSERMSSSAHQRETEDLRKAGLNPLLSLNSGASSPSGVTSSGAAADVDPVPSVMGGFLANAKESTRLMNDVRRASQEIKESKSRVDLQAEQKHVAEAQAESYRTSAKVNDAEFYRRNKENEFIEKNPWYIPTMRMIEAVGSGVSTARDAASMYRNIKGYGGNSVIEDFDDKGTHIRSRTIDRR